MKAKKVPLPRGFIKELRAKDIEELEALLAEIELREGTTVGPITRQREVIEKVLRKKRRERAGKPEGLLAESEVDNTGLPVTPTVESPETSVGDLNLLMNRVSVTAPPLDRILRDIATRLVQKTGGLVPVMEVKPYDCSDNKGQRFVVQWSIRRPITLRELYTLEHIARKAYECEIQGHKKGSAGWESVVRYVTLQDKTVPARKGIYFGTSGYYDSESEGITVHRRFSSAAEANYLVGRYPDDWIARSIEERKIETEIEIREGYTNKEKPGLAQENLLFLTVQISYLLAKQRVIENRVLMTAIYRELNRVGTNPIEREMLYGMKTVLQTIERVLLLALQKPRIARHYRFRPESMLLVGVPGIGKTFLAHYLMTGEYNAIFASIDSSHLRQDLVRSVEEGMSSVFLRIDRIREETALPVILLIDDIDVILDKDKEEMVAKFLTLMQGIRQKGFYALASTNYPEKVDKRLLEPGRFSKVIHVTLPDHSDRVGVLRNHLAALPFADDGERQKVAGVMAEKTEGWTQRYLWEMCVEAARFCGLAFTASEETARVDDYPMTLAHFERAHAELLKNINLKEIREWDDRIAQFVSNMSREIGWHVGKIS